jgi:hypothetical protein
LVISTERKFYLAKASPIRNTINNIKIKNKYLQAFAFSADNQYIIDPKAKLSVIPKGN